MDVSEALDELHRLLAATDYPVDVSAHLPVTLRAAADLAAAHLDAAPSIAALTAAALRHALETLAMEATLGAHCSQHPDTRPTLGEVAFALALQDASPLTDRPDLVAVAAAAVAARRPDADPDDVLLWAEARLDAGD